jgi:hypothetical protein
LWNLIKSCGSMFVMSERYQVRCLFNQDSNPALLATLSQLRSMNFSCSIQTVSCTLAASELNGLLLVFAARERGFTRSAHRRKLSSAHVPLESKCKLVANSWFSLMARWNQEGPRDISQHPCKHQVLDGNR